MRREDDVIAKLWAILPRRGDNAIARIEDRLHWHRNRIFYIAKQKKSGISLRELLVILDEAGVSTSWFFSSVFGSVTALDRFVQEGASLQDKLPAFYQRPKKSANTPPSISEIQQNFVEVKALSFVNAKTAERKAVALLHKANSIRSDDLVVKIGSWLAFFYYQQDKFHEAHACLTWTLSRVDAVNYSRLVWLAASVVIEYTDYKDAVALAEQAMAVAAEFGSVVDVSSALLIRSIGCRHLGMFTRAERGLKSALEMAPSEEGLLMCAINHELGALYEETGKISDAKFYLEAATNCECSDSPPGAISGRCYWLRARIAAHEGDYANSESFYRQALEQLSGSISSAAQATLELVTLLLKADEPGKAASVAVRFLPILESTTRSDSPITRITRTVIRNFALEAARGALDLAAAEGTLMKLQAEINAARKSVRVLPSGRPE